MRSTSTATGCSARSKKPRTSYRRRSCERGRSVPRSRGARRFVRGCTRSRQTPASTTCGGVDAERFRISCSVRARPTLPSIRTSPGFSRTPTRSSRRPIPRAWRSRRRPCRSLPRCHPGPHAPTTRGPAPARGVGMDRAGDRRSARVLGRGRGQCAPAGASISAAQPPRGPPRLVRDTTTAQEHRLLRRYIAAHEAGDADALARLLADTARFTMPPRAVWFEGRDAVVDEFRRGWSRDRTGDWRLVPTRANRQPAAAAYLRAWGDSTYRRFGFVVLGLSDAAISEITVFACPELFPAAGLASTLS